FLLATISAAFADGIPSAVPSAVGPVPAAVSPVPAAISPAPKAPAPKLVEPHLHIARSNLAVLGRSDALFGDHSPKQ
ncbi:hypothetical protein AB9F45_40025, partial [Rhizobium leguminosarum]